jgi:hypothetical protein
MPPSSRGLGPNDDRLGRKPTSTPAAERGLLSALGAQGTGDWDRIALMAALAFGAVGYVIDGLRGASVAFCALQLGYLVGVYPIVRRRESVRDAAAPVPPGPGPARCPNCGAMLR